MGLGTIRTSSLQDGLHGGAEEYGIYTFYIVVILIFMSLIFALWMFDDRRINRIAQTAFTPTW